MSSSCDVVIVGGGIAGLATAYELQRLGIGFRILERSARAGGVIFTEKIDGFTFDAGPDALLIQKPAAITLCKELGLGDRLFPTSLPRAAYILKKGTLHPLPESSMLGIPRNVTALAATRLFSLAGKARMAAELFVPRKTDGADESIASFIGRRFGREAVIYLAEPLLAGIHAGDVDRLSMRAFFPRFLDAERKYGSVLRAFRQVRQPRSSNGAFMSLPGGLEEIVRLHGITGEPLFAKLHRWERANARHNVGHLDIMAAIERRLAGLPGLFVTGSGFRGVGVPDCVADARRTAADVAAWIGSNRSARV